MFEGHHLVGGRMGYKDLVLLILFNLLLLLAPISAGRSSGVCVSPGGRFPPFSSQGKPPKKAAKGAKDLALCRVFRQNTCCDVAQTYPALLSIRRLASAAGEASQECLDLWELLECSICDPHVGVQPGPPLICSSLCDLVLQACSNAYFSIDTKTQVLSPCGLNDIVCGRASEWASNGTELCHIAGFSVHSTGDVGYQGDDGPLCYGGKASLESVSNSWRTSKPGSSLKVEKSNVLEDFQQWVKEMPISARISWAIGGMVLTAGLLFMCKRKSRSYRRKQAATIRTARSLKEGRINQQSLTKRK